MILYAELASKFLDVHLEDLPTLEWWSELCTAIVICFWLKFFFFPFSCRIEHSNAFQVHRDTHFPSAKQHWRSSSYYMVGRSCSGFRFDHKGISVINTWILHLGFWGPNLAGAILSRWVLRWKLSQKNPTSHFTSCEMSQRCNWGIWSFRFSHMLSLFFFTNMTLGTYRGRPLCNLFVKELKNHSWDLGIGRGYVARGCWTFLWFL